jgi:hypothetical protein
MEGGWLEVLVLLVVVDDVPLSDFAEGSLMGHFNHVFRAATRAAAVVSHYYFYIIIYI